MKLTKAQAHIANEIRRHHEAIRNMGEDLTKRVSGTTARLTAGYPDDNDTATIASRAAELGARVAARSALVYAARGAGMDEEFVAGILSGPFRYYMEGEDA